MINLLIQYLLALSCKRKTLSVLSNCCLVNDCLISMTLALIMLDMRHISLSVSVCFSSALFVFTSESPCVTDFLPGLTAERFSLLPVCYS